MNYFKIYCDLVDKRLKEPAFNECEKGVGEKHHIIPKSCENRTKILDLFSNYKVGQLVNFTYAEHYIAHCLLVKIFKNIDNTSYIYMLNAWNILNNRSKKIIGNKQYQYFKKEWNLNFNIGENNPSKRDEVKKKISDSQKGLQCGDKNGMWGKGYLISGSNHWHYGKSESLETRQKRSITLKEGYKSGRINHWAKGLTKETDERIKRLSNSLKGIPKKEEQKQKQSKIMKKKYVNGELIPWNKGKKMIITSGKNNPRAKAIVQLTLDGKLVREYDYIKQVEEYGFIPHIVGMCVNNKYKFGGENKNIYKKFIWKEK